MEERILSIIFYWFTGMSFTAMAYMRFDMGHYWLALAFALVGVLMYWAAARRYLNGRKYEN